MIEVRIICDKIAKTKTRLLKDLKVGDILKINHIFDMTTSSKKASFTVTNERTGESEEFSNNQFTNAIHEFSFRQI
jgi:hypothetical protein